MASRTTVRTIPIQQIINAWNSYCDSFLNAASKIYTEVDLMNSIANNSSSVLLSARPFSNQTRTSIVNTEVLLNNGGIDTSSFIRGDYITALNGTVAFIYNGARLECLNMKNVKPLIPKSFRALAEFPINYWRQVNDMVFADLSGLINTITNMHYSLDERVLSGNFDFDGVNYNIRAKIDPSMQAYQNLANDFGLMNSILALIFAVPQWFEVLGLDVPLSNRTLVVNFSGNANSQYASANA